MPKNSAKAIDLSIRNGRALLRPDIALIAVTGETPSTISDDVRVARVASIDARSEGFRIADTSVVVIDEVQARWIYALRLARTYSDGKYWPMFVLYHYFTLRLVACGLPKEASAFSNFFRAETQFLGRDKGFDTSDGEAETAQIERFVLGHELGHIAYKDGGAFIQQLRQTVHECSDDLTRLLRVTFTGDRSMLKADEKDERYEDIILSMKDYLNRFVFQEYAEDIKKYERDLLARCDIRTLEARRRRYDIFADIFERIDFFEEAFCDIYALEFRLSKSNGDSSLAAEIALECWRDLHAMTALIAMDSLARDRLNAAQEHYAKMQLVAKLNGEALSDDLVETLSNQFAEIETGRNSDRALLYYQVAMIKVIYRRVVFMNYIARHALLNNTDVIHTLETEGEKLEGQFIGACSSIRFKGIMLAEARRAGFGDVIDQASRVDLDRLWEDFIVRIPGMDGVTTKPYCDRKLHEGDKNLQDDGSSMNAFSANPVSGLKPRYDCVFCGINVSTTRLVVTNGRVSICDQCILAAEKDFACMPDGTAKRAKVQEAYLSPLPLERVLRADPEKPHCRFCEIMPMAAEPLVSSETGGAICAICVEAAAKIVRSKARGADPAYFISARATYEKMIKIAEESDSPVLTENMASVAESILAEYERELNPNFPGKEIWYLFTEPTMEPNIFCATIMNPASKTENSNT
jgi:hypothetical protein